MGLRLTKNIFFIALAIFSALLANSCVLSEVRPAGQERTQEIKFIRDGITTKREILNRLGTPREEFEEGQMFIYMMCRNPANKLSLSSDCLGGFGCDVYNLVLHFDIHAILKRHSLICVE